MLNHNHQSLFVMIQQLLEKLLRLYLCYCCFYRLLDAVFTYCQYPPHQTILFLEKCLDFYLLLHLLFGFLIPSSPTHCLHVSLNIYFKPYHSLICACIYCIMYLYIYIYTYDLMYCFSIIYPIPVSIQMVFIPKVSIIQYLFQSR